MDYHEHAWLCNWLAFQYQKIFLFKVLIKAEKALYQLFEQNTHQTKDKYYLAPLEAKPDKDCKVVPKSAVNCLYEVTDKR